MRLSRKAQSILEYTVVIILITAGIILMRPYVFRGVNAHMKSWEDGVKDSIKEPLRPVKPPDFGGCNCSSNWWDDPACCAVCNNINDGHCCPDQGEATCGGPSFSPLDCPAAVVCGDHCCAGAPYEDANSCCEDCESNCGDSHCCTDRGLDSVDPLAVPVGGDALCKHDCPTQLCIPACNHNCTCESDCENPGNCDDCAHSCGNTTCEPCENANNWDATTNPNGCWYDCHCVNGSCENFITGSPPPNVGPNPPYTPGPPWDLSGAQNWSDIINITTGKPWGEGLNCSDCQTIYLEAYYTIGWGIEKGWVDKVRIYETGTCNVAIPRGRTLECWKQWDAGNDSQCVVHYYNDTPDEFSAQWGLPGPRIVQCMGGCNRTRCAVIVVKAFRINTDGTKGTQIFGKGTPGDDVYRYMNICKP